MSSPLFNAHSHHPDKDKESLTLRSFSYPKETPIESELFTFGAHPWHADQFNCEDFKSRLKSVMDSENFLALGECGLDRARETSWQDQLESFQAQLNIARDLEIPVVIIHCVRAYSEVLAQVKASGFNGRLLFHDFNASKEEAQKLISLGHYLSLGKTLDRENSKVRKYLTKEMLSHLLVETDDEEDIKIQERYQQLGSILAMDQETLRDQIWKNAIQLFGERLESKL